MNDIVFKNNNENIIKKLSKKQYKSNKGRNIVAILAIILTTMMFTTLFTLSQSIEKNLIEMTFRQMGYNTQVSLSDDLTDEKIEKIKSHPDAKEVGRSIIVGIAENPEHSGKQLEIRYADESYAKHSFALPTVGKLPDSEDEIALSNITLDRLQIPYELGQEVTLKWRNNYNSNEYITKTFKLSGYWEANENVYAVMGWVSEDFALANAEYKESNLDGQYAGMRNADVELYSDKNIEKTMDKILKDVGLDDLNYNVNLAYDSRMKTTSFMESIPMYVSMVLVFIAGFLIIYNVFQISIISDIQFYGKLKTLGTTRKQLKKLIYKQSNKLSTIGIPIGLVLGYGLGAMLVPIFLKRTEGTAAFNPFIFIGSAVFAWLTVRISCIKPATVAGKVSPMEALRYGEESSASKKTVKKGKHGGSPLHMAWSNLGRNKKRTALVVLSLSLAMVMLSVNYVKNSSFDVELYVRDMMISDFAITDSSAEDYFRNEYNPQGTTISNELLQAIDDLPGIEDRGELYFQEILLPLSEEAKKNIKAYYTEEDLKFMENQVGWVEGYQSALEKGEVMANIFGADGLVVDILAEDRYVMDGTFDKEAFASGDYIIAVGTGSDDYSEKMPTFSVGEKIKIQNKEFEVMAVVFPTTPVFDGVESEAFNLGFLISGEAFKEFWPNNTMRKFYFNIEDEYIPQAESLLSDYQANFDPSMPYESRQLKIEQFKESTQANSITEVAMTVVLAMVGILNFANSMITAIFSRKKEFAMIQSVGMTKRQLRKMLILEGIFYIILTLIVSYIASTLSIMSMKYNMSSGYSTYKFSLLPLNICTPILIALAVVIPYICFKNIEKQSIVERLRQN